MVYPLKNTRSPHSYTHTGRERHRREREGTFKLLTVVTFGAESRWGLRPFRSEVGTLNSKAGRLGGREGRREQPFQVLSLDTPVGPPFPGDRANTGHLVWVSVLTWCLLDARQGCGPRATPARSALLP